MTRRLYAKHLIAILSEREDTDSKLMLAVSKRVGNAVVRNRIKRVFRSAFRRTKPLFSGLDVILVAKASEGIDTETIVKELSSLEIYI